MAKEVEKVSGYGLSRSWFDFSFENQDILVPAHTAMFLWFLELNNRMGWSLKFASPASQTMAAIGLKSYNTYKKIFDDLVKFGFVKVITESKNQYTACIIALSNNNKSQYKALDKAVTKHSTKQGESTIQSIDSINKPLNKETNKLINKRGTPIESTDKSFELNGCDFGYDFRVQWELLIQTKKWKNKDQSSLDASLKKLMRFDEKFATTLVENAIAGEYQGVVFSDTDSVYQKHLKEEKEKSSGQKEKLSKIESNLEAISEAKHYMSKIAG